MKRIAPLIVAMLLAFPAFLIRLPAGVGAQEADPEYPHGAFEDDCTLCHSPDAWAPAALNDAFDHAAYGPALEGAHAATPCGTCHVTLAFSDSSPECAGCHQDVHDGALGIDCADCHTLRSFGDHARLLVRHQETRLPLTGTHSVLECESCHAATDAARPDYAAARPECVSCHAVDYDAVEQPPHAEAHFSDECSLCHGTVTWDGGVFSTAGLEGFDHGAGGFPLQGAHATLDCASCHGGGMYHDLSAECAACHQVDYDGTTDPAHAAAGYPLDCRGCHGMVSWDGADFDHAVTEFPLTGAHMEQNCASCHGGGVYNGLATECAACHQDDYDGTTDPNHLAAGFSSECQTCHTTATWDDAAFDHATTSFALTGAHTTQDCASCHGGGVFNGLATECASCHQDDYDGTIDPAHAAAGYPLDCQTCHSTTVWDDAVFDHAASDFPLTGAHMEQNCASCHGGGVYNGLATECAACHQDDYDTTTDPNHLAAGFSSQCQTCHTTATWDDAAFDHATTSFALTGAHTTQDCASCHGGGVYNGLATQCAACHQDDYDATTDPAHATAGYPLDCQTCHSTTVWEDAEFDHAASDFPLTGAHVEQNCVSCHGGGVFNGLATQCAACHQDDYDGTTDPNHLAAGFSSECRTCHSTATWDDATFDHATTSFALTGAHTTQDCASCHGGGVFNGLATECAACHQDDYSATTDPDHLAAGFASQCQTCHTTATWDDAAFDHATTSFALTGAHTTQDCASCHGGGVFNGLAAECASCHQDDYDGTIDPAHAAAGYPLDCQTCHSTVVWEDAEFDHAASDFPLTGAHAEQNCASCHGGGVYNGLATECAACHQDDYSATTDPDHLAAGFSSQCQTCHSTATWDDASFDHATTSFVLTGAHTAQPCASCHGGGVYNGLATECAACHQDDYDVTIDPPHAAAGYPMACQSCHSTISWDGGTYNHNLTSFPLTGAHQALDCLSCHGGGVYNGLATECAACHQDDYSATTDPDHLAAGFSSQCQTCHTTSAWEGATFNHAATSFALTGAHTTQACASCHGGGVYNGLAAECAACHQDDYDGTTDPAHAAAGYPLDCLTCHTTTVWEDAEFDHAASDFPLTGAHQALECLSCHGGGVYNGLASECAACHQDDYDVTIDPPHAAAGYPMDCAQCHGTATWADATFDHNLTAFPLTGSHVEQNCASCHGGGVYNGLASECAACHQDDYDGTTAPNHLAAGFASECQTCHSTAQWPGATYDHALTTFPLTGAHLAVDCASCHGSGVYNGLDARCEVCHADDAAGTLDPNHLLAGFTTQCQTCHTTTAWPGAAYNHGLTSFPLTGAHAAEACNSCHGGGVYNGLATQCAACHQNDYDGTTDPNHLAAGFPTSCETCHGTTTWLGATFNHDTSYFPIYSGRHRDKWDACTDCHQNPVDFGTFTCLTCHPHSDKLKTDSDHREEAGYQYSSLACYSCHPRGD